jgi:purine-binding chemotaxis protein CheW
VSIACHYAVDNIQEEVGDEISDDGDVVSLCCVYAGTNCFGIETKRVREILNKCELHRVPLTPAFVAGVVSYRGEVLTTVDLRVLLGLGERLERGCVMVLDGEDATEPFGLVIDEVGGVVKMSASTLEVNPCTLQAREKWLFGGSYRLGTSLMVQLDAQKLCPSRLAGTGLFRHRVNGGLDASLDR